MKRPRVSVHVSIKTALGYSPHSSSSTVIKDWKQITRTVCKPCWELRYCPYGPLVEQSPLLPPPREHAIQHHEYLKACLRTGKMADGRRLDAARRKYFQSEVRGFDPADYPKAIPAPIDGMQCSVFGHICPVAFAAEGFTETSQLRRRGRYISFRTKMRVVRRDNYTCQHCEKHLQDNEVEFDHIIPVAKGGSSEEHNIRLTCHDCNADKSDRVNI